MADQFLAEQHSWTLIRNAQSNDEDSWVMLTRDGEIVPIPGEKILHTSRPRVSLELSTPRELQVAEPYSFKCDNGIAYITNQRVRSPAEGAGWCEANQSSGNLPPGQAERRLQVLLFAGAELYRHPCPFVMDRPLELGWGGEACSWGRHSDAHPPDRSQVDLPGWRPQRLPDQV